jgi:transposase
MSISSYFVGIDVSKPFLDVHRLPDQAQPRFANTAAGHRQLIAWLREQPIGLIVLEASGGYERAAVVAMVNAELPVFVAQPGIIRDFARSLLIRAKTDAIDAAVLARYAQHRIGDVKPVADIDPVQQELAAQVARRDDLLKMHTQEQNRLQQVADKLTRKSIQRTLAFLQKEIARIEKAIDRTITADPVLAARSKTLQETRGVGPQTARTLIACLPELGNAGPKRLNTLVGVAPYAQDSGDKHGPRHIAGGRKLVRNALYMAALSASRCNPVIAGYYRSMRSRGLAHKTALMACIRRLLAYFDKLIRQLSSANTPGVG